MLVALTREISPNLHRCELTHLPRTAIDLDAAREEHRQYEECLAGLGCAVRRLPAAPELPDGVFVEDTCVVLDELAVIARPGPESRRAETETAAEALRPHRELRFIGPPGTLEGGDVLQFGRRVLVGASGRTNEEGVAQLRAFLAPLGYSVTPVNTTGCLHLKTAACPVGERAVLVNPAWVSRGVFSGLEVIEVGLGEPFGANALLVDDTVVVPSAHARTRERLERRGVRTRAVAFSEMARAEAGVTCCSVLFRTGADERAAP